MTSKNEKIKIEQEKRKQEYLQFKEEIGNDPILSEIEKIKEEVKSYELAIKKNVWKKQSDRLKAQQSIAKARNKLRNYEQRYGLLKKQKQYNQKNKHKKTEFNPSDINQVATDQLKFMESLTDLHYIKDKNFFNTALDEFRKKYINVKYKHDTESGEITRNIGTKNLKTKESKDWFTRKIKGLVNQHIKKNDNGFVYTEILNNKSATSQSTVKVGNVYFFGYNPKYWKDMEFYDLFPLVLILGISGKHIYGLNLHYLPRKQRMNVLLKCLGLKNEDGYESKVTEEIEKYLNDSFELMDTDIQKFDEFFNIADSHNELVDEYNEATEKTKRDSILKRIKESAEKNGYGTGYETGSNIFEIYDNNLTNMLKKIKLDIKDKRKLFLKDLENLKSDKRIKTNDVDGSGYPKLFKKYILDEGRIASGRFIFIPIEEYKFVVDLPGYWMETDRKQPRKTRTATHTSRNYQY